LAKFDKRNISMVKNTDIVANPNRKPELNTKYITKPNKITAYIYFS